jgi:pilus assembly protein CpaB
MEDKTKRPSSLGTIGFMIAAIIFAAIAGILFSQVMESTYSQEPVKPIVVAAKIIPAAQPMIKEDLKLASWPESAIPAGAFTKIEDAIAKTRVPLVPLVPGEAVLTTHLSKPSAGMGIAPLVDENKRAIAITTDNPVTLARLLYPGALVDVLSTMRDSSSSIDDEKPRVSTKVVLQNIKVLAVGEDIDPLTITNRRRAARKKAAEGGGALTGESSDARETRAVVTLLVTPEEAERLTLARREGDIDLILRNPKDTGEVDTPGATPAAFLPSGELDEENAALLEGLASGNPVSEAASGRRPRSRRSRKIQDAKPAETKPARKTVKILK